MRDCAARPTALAVLLGAALVLGCAADPNRDPYAGRDRPSDPYTVHPVPYGNGDGGDHKSSLERHREREQRALDAQHEAEDRALDDEQKSERKELKQTDQWDAQERQRQHDEQRALESQQKQEQRDLEQHQKQERQQYEDDRD